MIYHKLKFFLALLLFWSTGVLAFSQKAKQEDWNDKFTKSSVDEFRKNWQNLNKADKIRLQTISSIQAMVNRNIDDNKKFELYLRLGELFAERSDYLRTVEIHNWELRYDAWEKAKKSGQEPVLSNNGSKSELLKAAASFRRLVNNYPNHPRVDSAMLALAQALDELDNPLALTYYLKLIKSYPNSPLMAETYLALGEYYFDRKKFTESQSYYLRATRYKQARGYTYAVYKLGWAYYNSDGGSPMGQFKYNQKALTAFKLTVRLSDHNRHYRGLDLRREAINDLVMVWAEIEGVHDAWQFFSRVGELEAFYDVLEKLGRTYADQGKNQKAVETFEKLLSQAPHRERVPEILIKLIGLEDQLGDISAVVKDFKRLYETVYIEGPWLKANKKNIELIAESRSDVIKQLHRYSALYHQRGQKSNSAGQMKTAMILYRYFLTNFPNEKVSYEIRYYLADIYYYFKMYSPASDEYLRVALIDKNGKFHKDAALNAVMAMNTLVVNKSWPKLPELGKVSHPIEIPREKQKLIRVIDAYVALLPNESAGNVMRITAAKVLFTYGHYPESLDRFEKIALSIPLTKEGKVSLETILNFHTSKQQWFAVIEKSRKYLATNALSQGQHRLTITDHLKNAVLKLGIAYASGKHHLKAANTFLAFQKEFPMDPNADKALFNASQNLYEIDLVDQALATDRLLLKSYPKSALVPDVNISIARTYEGIAEYDEAANFYYLFAKTYPNDNRAAPALFNAATLYKGLKQYEPALQAFNDFLGRYPSHSAVSDVYFEMGLVFEKTNQYANAVNSYDLYIAKANGIDLDRQLFVKATAASLLYKYVNANLGEARLQQLAEYLKGQSQSPAFEARRIVAKTRFDRIEPKWAQFKQFKIRSAKTLEADVKHKQSMLLAMAQDYDYVISIGSGEYNVASLYQLGQLHEAFADDLFNAPEPIAADQLTIDQYRSSIEKVAFPLKEEAAKFYETAYKRSSEVATFTDWTRKAYEKMAALFPERHPEILEKGVQPVYLSHNLTLSDDVDGLIE